MELSPEEQQQKIKENPLYGRVICRCETITEGEIVEDVYKRQDEMFFSGRSTGQSGGNPAENETRSIKRAKKSAFDTIAENKAYFAVEALNLSG